MAKALISDVLCECLCQQYAHEKYNANFYLVLSAFFKNKGMDRIGNFFKQQHDEEVKHSLQIFDFLTDMNAPFKAMEIDAVDVDTSSIISIAEEYLSREEMTTDDLISIKDLCIKECNGVAEEFIRKMIQQQEHELSESSSFMDSAELCGNDWFKVKLWNDSLEG